MKIGVDFDGVVIAIDRLIHRLAVEAGFITDDVLPRAKEICAHLERLGQAQRWDALADEAHGVWHADAPAWSGVHDFFRRGRQRGLSLVIVGQRPRERWEQAQDWLARQGFFNPYDIALPRPSVFFEATLVAQTERLRALGCTHFISDRAAILEHPTFPASVRKILFEPEPSDAVVSGATTRARGWNHLSEFFLSPGTR
ncbi:MAG TPA: hypothetical protein VH374_11690 [Polyangia bacterium]|jgi:hypothetical protein|nr:hypothetical protein [Polyangia bacterium]